MNYRQTHTVRNIVKYDNAKGYYRVRLKNKDAYVHRLVADAFIENNNKDRVEVNHINGNTHDNRLCNLEWVTHSENMKHAFNNNLIKLPRICNIGQYTVDDEFVKEWHGAGEIKRQLGLDSSAIIKCCKGKLKTCGRYKWKYI